MRIQWTRLSAIYSGLKISGAVELELVVAFGKDIVLSGMPATGCSRTPTKSQIYRLYEVLRYMLW